MCHKREKGQLRASLSWLTGSHLSGINTGHTLTQVFSYPLISPSVLCHRILDCFHMEHLRRRPESPEWYLFFYTFGGVFAKKVALDIEVGVFCPPTSLAPGFPSIVMTTVCTHRHELWKTVRSATCWRLLKVANRQTCPKQA